MRKSASCVTSLLPYRWEYSKNRSETQSDARLLFLGTHDVNGFVRIDSCHALYMKAILRLEQHIDGVAELVGHLLDAALCDDRGGSFRQILHYMLNIPDELYVLDNYPQSDLGMLTENRKELIHTLARTYEEQWERVAAVNPVERPYVLSTDASSVRSMRHLAFKYLAICKGESNVDEFAKRMVEEYRNADNLTDRLAAYTLVTELPDANPKVKELIAKEFYDRWQSESLVLDEWFRVQAQCSLPGGIERVKELAKHPQFDEDLPSRFRCVYQAFADRNIPNFHSSDGSGYSFFADAVIARDAKNPQVAARLTQPLTRWQRFDPKRQDLICAELHRILNGVESPELKDLVSRALGK